MILLQLQANKSIKLGGDESEPKRTFTSDI